MVPHHVTQKSQSFHFSLFPWTVNVHVLNACVLSCIQRVKQWSSDIRQIFCVVSFKFVNRALVLNDCDLYSPNPCTTPPNYLNCDLSVDIVTQHLLRHLNVVSHIIT
jgi:hypothetical protein